MKVVLNGTTESERVSELLTKVVRVPHATIQARIDADKDAKEQRRGLVPRICPSWQMWESDNQKSKTRNRLRSSAQIRVCRFASAFLHPAGRSAQISFELYPVQTTDHLETIVLDSIPAGRDHYL
jgi:hypothetical protein